MQVVFADANYWIGLFNPKDQLHDAALAASRTLTRARLVTLKGPQDEETVSA